MRRITIAIDDDLAAEIDRFAEFRGYQNRSEALRDLARSGLGQVAEERTFESDGVGALIYVYDHEARNLSKRLTLAFHAHHELSVSAMHVHLDHAACLEVNILRGRPAEIRDIACRVIAERSVRYGQLIQIPAELERRVHEHQPRSNNQCPQVQARRSG